MQTLGCVSLRVGTIPVRPVSDESEDVHLASSGRDRRSARAVKLHARERRRAVAGSCRLLQKQDEGLTSGCCRHRKRAGRGGCQRGREHRPRSDAESAGCRDGANRSHSLCIADGRKICPNSHIASVVVDDVVDRARGVDDIDGLERTHGAASYSYMMLMEPASKVSVPPSVVMRMRSRVPERAT